MTDNHEAARLDRLSISQSTVEGIRVVTLRGEIDHETSGDLGSALSPAEGSEQPRTVVDLAGVTFMDSSGINTLISAHLAAEGARGWLRLAAPQPPVLRVIQLVGIDTLIPHYPGRDEALRA